MLYAGLLSAFAAISGCSSKLQTRYLNYPVVVEGIKSMYAIDSNDDCHLKLQRSDQKEWRIYDQQCDNLADSVMIVSPDDNFSYYQRQQLTAESQQALDALLQQGAASLHNRYRTRNYDEVQF